MEPGPPATAPTQAPTTRQKVPWPQSPPLTGQGPRAQASTAPTEATVNLLELSNPAITYSKDATAALQKHPMAQGAEWVPHLLTFQEQGLQREDPREMTPIFTPDGKAYKCYLHQGTSLTPEPASTSNSSTT